MCTATLWTHCGLERRVMRFPAFSWFQQKIWLECKILTPHTYPCAAIWRKNINFKNSHKKTWPIFDGQQRFPIVIPQNRIGFKILFGPKSTRKNVSRENSDYNIGWKMARKMSGFSPFLTPCAQGGGPWGPWGGFFEVPPGAHQITPQGHWSGSY